MELRGGARLLSLTLQGKTSAAPCVSLSWVGLHSSTGGSGIPGFTWRDVLGGGVPGSCPGLSYVAGFRDLPADHSCTTQNGTDPLSAALREVRATVVLHRNSGCFMARRERNVPWRVRNTECANCRNVEFANNAKIIGEWEFFWALLQAAPRRIMSRPSKETLRPCGGHPFAD